MSMTCDTVSERLDALADGELSPAEARDVHAHVAGCAECASRLGEIRSIGAAVREQAPRYRAPDSLRAAVRASIRTAAALGDGSDESVDAARQPRLSSDPTVSPASVDSTGSERPSVGETRIIPIARARPNMRRWLAAAATIAMLLAGTGRAAWMAGEASARRDAQAEQVLAGHVRSLMGTHLADVASTDQHTVKPWFDGRLDFAPPVYDLADQGFPLTGGRLDYVDGHRAAAMVYARRKHWINLFVWPVDADAPSAPRWQTRRGYHMAQWDAAGMRHWAVSDVNEAELRTFVTLLREREPLTTPADAR
jgi:anti-sigma factor RsiW